MSDHFILCHLPLPLPQSSQHFFPVNALLTSCKANFCSFTLAFNEASGLISFSTDHISGSKQNFWDLYGNLEKRLIERLTRLLCTRGHCAKKLLLRKQGYPEFLNKPPRPSWMFQKYFLFQPIFKKKAFSSQSMNQQKMPQSLLELF